MTRAGRPLKVDPELEYLYRLVDNNDIKTMNKIIQKFGIDAYDGNKRTILILASANGKNDIVKMAIDKGADINFQDQSGYTALHFCALNKNVELTDMLIDNGANVDVRDEHGNSPIWTAIFNAKGDFKIVNKLFKAGADIDSKNIHGKSPRDFGKTVYQEKFEDLLNG